MSLYLHKYTNNPVHLAKTVLFLFVFCREAMDVINRVQVAYLKKVVQGQTQDFQAILDAKTGAHWFLFCFVKPFC